MIHCYSFVRSTGAFTYKGLRQCCTINRQRRNLAHGVARSVIVSRLFVLHQVDWNSLVLDRLPRQCWEERGKMERWKRNEKKGKEKCAAKNQQKAKRKLKAVSSRPMRVSESKGCPATPCFGNLTGKRLESHVSISSKCCDASFTLMIYVAVAFILR